MMLQVDSATAMQHDKLALVMSHQCQLRIRAPPVWPLQYSLAGSMPCNMGGEAMPQRFTCRHS